MHLYHCQLQKPTAITKAIVGNFSGSKHQELLVCRGTSVLEILHLDNESGQLSAVISKEIYGTIRSLEAFRLTGGTKDYIAIGSDSGRIVILEYRPEKKKFDKLHQETYGRSGMRRIVPGEFIAVDPKGRALMIGAIERQKFVFVLNQDSEAHLTISSPLEAHRSHTLCFDLVSLDVGYENPIFASLEMEYPVVEDDDTLSSVLNDGMFLTFYELDLGLNHVIRKWSEPVEKSANHLVPLPGGFDGPGGVLVCSEGSISWMNQGYDTITVPIPMCDGSKKMITSHVVHKMKSSFFTLLQNEDGDLFKVSVIFDKDVVSELKIKYYDSLPIARSLCIFKSGLLFSSSESNDSLLLQVESLGENGEDEAVEYSSSDMMDEEPKFQRSLFDLIHLSPVYKLESLAPAIDMHIANLTDDDAPEIVSLCGTGLQSSIKILKQGLEVNELVSYPLPGTPSGIWAVRNQRDDEYLAYMIISFADATLVLSIGETVEEVGDSGFLTDSPTLNVEQIGQKSIVQVYPGGVRQILSDGRAQEWTAPEGTTVIHSSSNNMQVAVALSNNEIVYFEVDEADNLNEFEENSEMPSDITCIAVGSIPTGRKRSNFLAVGLKDQTIRLMSLETHNCLEALGMQALNALPYSLLIADIADEESDGVSRSTLYLNVGLENGVMIRSVMDQVTGSLSDSRSRYLGASPVKLASVSVQGATAVLSLSTRPWLTYNHHRRTHTTPLTYSRLRSASSFISEQCPEGIVCIAGDTLRIISLENLGKDYHFKSIPLAYTPRKLLIDPLYKKLIVLESQHNTRTVPLDWHGKLDEKQKRLNGEVDEDEEIPIWEPTPLLPCAGSGKWVSQLRIIDPASGSSLQIYPFANNEAALSACIFRPYSDHENFYLAVAIGKDVQLKPKSSKCGYIDLFKFVLEENSESSWQKLHFVHRTFVDTAPYALCDFQGRLLVGVGKILRLYEVGKKQLLRKTEARIAGFEITDIKAVGPRIFAQDIQESVHVGFFSLQENKIHVFADDSEPRWMSRMAVLDPKSLAGVDKFGNFFVSKIPDEVDEGIQDELIRERILTDPAYLFGAPHKLETQCQFYQSTLCTALQYTPLIPGGRSVLVYMTIFGEIGMYVPMSSREDIELFTELETQIRNFYDGVGIAGRDFQAFRSSYLPVKNVIDGSLVEEYSTELPLLIKEEIAEGLDGRSSTEVERLIELMRTRVS